MPELPEVETVARSLRPRLCGRTIASVRTSGLSLRAPVDARRLSAACAGARVDAIDRVGKYLVVRLSRGDCLLTHLGMTGRFVVVDEAEPHAPHTHAVFRLEGGGELRYVDPRRFGTLVVYPAAALARSPELSVLGVDPLGPDFTLAHFLAELDGSRRDVKQFLLDQSHVAGLGNIYVCEALYRAGISPRRRAGTLGPARAARLHATIVAVLEEAVAHRGTTLRDYVDAAGDPGENQLRLDVYGREADPCHACRTPIRRIVQGARSTFFCPRCQK